MRDLHEIRLLEDRLRALIHVSQAITGTRELDEVLDLVVESAIGVFPAAQKGSIHLYDEKTGMLHIRACYGYSPEVAKALTLKVGEGRAGWVYEHATPLIVGNVQEDGKSRKVDRRIKCSEVQEQKSAICVPLAVADRVIGALSLDNITAFNAFRPEDRDLLSLFASQATAAILNAELRERLRKLQMLSRASNEIMSNLHSLSLDDRLNMIVRHAVLILDAEAGTIFLVKRPGFVTKEACYGHVEKDFQKGKELAIRSGRKTGLTGHIAYTGKLFNAHGDELATHWAVTGEKPVQVVSGQCHSLLAIPLKRRIGDEEHLIGLLEAENKKDKDGQPKSDIGFTKEDEWILSIFAETVVICLENAELYERTSDRLEEKVASLKAIQETSAAISAELDFGELLELITEKAARVFAAPAVSLMLWDNGQEELVVRAKYGLTDEYSQQRVPRERVDTAIAMMGGLHPLATLDLRSTPFGRLDLDEAEHLCSVLSAPLVVSGGLIGILNIYSKDKPRQFASDEIEVAEVIASQATVAIRNAQLYEETTRRANALQALYEASRAVTATLTPNDLFNVIVEQAWRLTRPRQEKTHFSHLAFVDRNHIRFVAAFPPDALAKLKTEVKEIDLERDMPIGITGSVVVTRCSRLEGNVSENFDYIETDPRVRSQLSVPIRMGEHIIGVIGVEHVDYNAFDEEDRRTLESLAAQVAVAIENARLYEKQQQEAKQLALINQIAADISSSLDLEKILQTLVNQLAGIIGVEQCAIAIFDEKGEYGDVVAEYLQEGCVPSKGEFRIPLRDNPAIELARMTKRPVAVKDAQYDPRMEGVWDIMRQRRTQSIMIVPIVIRGELIGTIGLDAVSGPRDFTIEEQWLAETIAHHASIAIQNARRYEELKRTKGLIGARTALAWMGMVSSEWKHRIRNQAQTIQEQVQHLRKDLQLSSVHYHHPAIGNRLSMIERLAVQIREKPIIPPLSAEEGVVPFAINDLIGERAKQLWQNDPYQRTELRLDLRLDNTIAVRASSEWLRRAFDILVDNAVEAMVGCETQQITVATRPTDGGVEIVVSDTGIHYRTLF